MSEKRIQASRRKVAEWLETFNKQMNAAAFYMVTDQLVYLQTKPLLKKEEYTKNLFLSEAIGNWPRYRLGISVVGMYMASPDGTPMNTLEKLTFEIIDRLTEGYYRKKIKSKLSEFPSYNFRKILRQEMNRMARFGHVSIKGDKVFQKSIVPELIPIDFFGNILHIPTGKSGWKRAIITTKVGLHSPRYSEIASLLRTFHKGEEYGLKNRDVDRWWSIQGPEGSGLAFTDRWDFVYLQYEKARYQEPINLNSIQSEAVRSIHHTIQSLPFISEKLLVELYGIHAFRTFIDTCQQHKGLSPLKLADSYVSRGLGYLLQWGLKTDIVQHPSRLMLTKLYEMIRPRLDEIKELGSIIRYSLAELAANQEFRASTYLERNVMNSLVSLGLLEVKGDLYSVKSGMEEAAITLSKYTGNIFAGKRSKASKVV